MFLLISTKLRSLDPTLLYCIDSDWTPLSIAGKKLVSLGTKIPCYWCPSEQKLVSLGTKFG